MSNTLIQIKRSLSTLVPPGGSLAIGEQAYSYSSNTLFIGTPDGLGVLAIGGKFYVDAVTAAFAQANAAYQTANNGLTVTLAFTQANNAYAQANIANITADLAFTHANNSYAKANAALPQSGGTVTGDLVITGNITVSGMTTYTNTQTLMIGDNIFVVNADLPAGSAPSEDAGFVVNRGSSANAEILWKEGVDKWSFNDGVLGYRYFASNTDIETTDSKAVASFVTANLGFTHANNSYAFANSAHTVANVAYTHANNAYAQANAASAQAANADFLTSGTVVSARISGSYTGITGVGTIAAGTWEGNTVKVPYGGTGMVSFTTNGIVYGNNAGDLKVTAAGTEGQVLQASSTGVPGFGMLDGGTF